MSAVVQKSNKSNALTGGFWNVESEGEPGEQEKSTEKNVVKKRSLNIGGTWGFDDGGGEDALLNLNVSVGRGCIPDDSSIDDSSIGSADYVDTSMEVYEASDNENSVQPAGKTSSMLGGLLDHSQSDDSPDESLDGTDSSLLGPNKKHAQFGGESSRESFSKRYARSSLPPRPPGKGDSRYTKSCNILRQLNNLETTDTEIYEDEQEDSSKCESESNDERSRGSRSYNSHGSQRSDFNWSSYNQKRGRYLAKRLLSKVHEKQPLNRMDSQTILSDRKHLLSFGMNNWFQRHHHIGATTKQISKDYVVVDATVDHGSNVTDDSPSQPSNLRGLKLPHPHSASYAKANATKSDKLMVIQEQSTIVRTPGFPEGLLRRTTVDEIISTQKLGSKGRKAVQKLDRLLKEKNKPNASFKIWGVEIINYEARVKSFVATFRRDVLEISDAKYLDLLTKA